MLLLVAVVGVAQGALEVSITCTTSPLTRDDVVNVGLLVPALHYSLAIDKKERSRH
jgi:hypothetical protein